MENQEFTIEEICEFVQNVVDQIMDEQPKEACGNMGFYILERIMNYEQFRKTLRLH